MTTFDLFRRAGVPAAAVALFSLAACSGTAGSAAGPTATVTVTATPAAPAESSAPAAPTPSVSAAPSVPVADPTGDDKWPPISDKTPPVFGGVFQSDPGHDFTRGISPSRDGVLRGELRTMQDANVVEYVPVRFVRDVGGQTTGHFEGPPEGDAMAFAAQIDKNVVFLSAVGCDGNDQTINGDYVGTQRCSRNKLILRADKGELYALITVKGGHIVKVVEIYTP
ncbi:hypothetical protein [Microbispora sp. ATCC PTA-5024]|uniref:hypothetical protein n=1 Tax=Microbispora sp. ATCC PTA-5024 TaxID=316330 RepID=UPI0003DC2003|nr:hypothetical protein [Microbispora sp. ATCC PTA-5024]ETK37958.1 hypothetical protein MPTA5024_01030 [Microbispora sp. ATCC PTA-5024]